MDLEKLSIEKVKRGIEKKEFSALSLTNAFLEKIEKEDGEISSILHIAKEKALKKAKEIDKLKKLPPLAGVPVLLKDNILFQGEKCTAGSKVLENYVAPYQARVVDKLEEAGAIILGKTNMDEFAMGSSNENSAFFPTKNPHDKKRVPGGSSGGSAAALAANFCLFSLGSDTGGSIRQPAAFCGVVGLKPSYGRVSRYGLIAMASSLDQIGPITKSVKEARAAFNVIKGKDKKDATTLKREEKRKEDKKVRIGVPKEYFPQGMDKEVSKRIKGAIEKVGKEMEIVEISLPHTRYALASYHIIMDSEVSSNMARFDGIRYGYKEKENLSLEEIYLKNRNLLGDEVKRRIILGTFALSSGYYDDYYLRAKKARSLIREDFDKVFKKGITAVVSPTTPTLPFNLGERVDDPLSMYLADAFTVPASLAGLPAISIPLKEEGKFPLGVQLTGNFFGEEELLSLAQKWEEILK